MIHKCTWWWHRAMHSQILLAFTSLQTTEINNCQTDHILLFCLDNFFFVGSSLIYLTIIQCWGHIFFHHCKGLLTLLVSVGYLILIIVFCWFQLRDVAIDYFLSISLYPIPPSLYLVAFSHILWFELHYLQVLSKTNLIISFSFINFRWKEKVGSGIFFPIFTIAT